MDLRYGSYFSSGTGLLVLDTSAAVTAYHSLEKRDLLQEVLDSGVTLVVPAPVTMEFGCSDMDLSDTERKFMQRISRSYFLSTETETTYGFGRFWTQAYGFKEKVKGQIQVVLPDQHAWDSAWHVIRAMMKKRSAQNARKQLVDILIANTARNLFAPIWTENLKDFFEYSFYHDSRDYVPLFNTDAIIRAINGAVVYSMDSIDLISNEEIKKAFAGVDDSRK